MTMMLQIFSFVAHYLSIIVFFILIPFPMFFKGHDLDHYLPTFKKVIKAYNVILFIAYFALFVSIISGLIIEHTHPLWWTAVVCLLWLIITFFVFFTHKYVRLLSQEMKNGKKKTVPSVQNALLYSRLLTIAILVMFGLKYVTIYM